MEKMTEKQYAPGEDIIVQGEKGEHYYIIESGRVAVLKSKKGAQEYQQVAVLDAGEAFGEEALIRDDPRNATCRAIEKTTVAALHKKDFNQIMKPSFLDNIFPEDVSLDTYLDEYVIIDARIPAEYEEAHGGSDAADQRVETSQIAGTARADDGNLRYRRRCFDL